MNLIEEYNMMNEVAEHPIRQRGMDWIIKGKRHYKSFPNQKTTFKPGVYAVDGGKKIIKLTKEMWLDDIALFLAHFDKYISDYNMELKPSDEKVDKITVYDKGKAKKVEFKIPDVYSI